MDINQVCMGEKDGLQNLLPHPVAGTARIINIYRHSRYETRCVQGTTTDRQAGSWKK
jgi:hypothetical protein